MGGVQTRMMALLNVRLNRSRALARPIAKRLAILAVSFALCGAMLPAIARADDSTAIVTAMDQRYAGQIFAQIHWTSIQISEVRPYAMFFARNGLSGVNDLLKESGGRWRVVLPSKGREDRSILISMRVPRLVAARLLAECPPAIDSSMYRPPFTFVFKLDGRVAHSTISSVRIPARTLHFQDGNSERIDIAPPIDAQLCTPR